MHIGIKRTAQTFEIEILGEYIEHDAVGTVLYDADTHHGSASRTRGIHHERIPRIEGIYLEGCFLIVARFAEYHALANGMKPIAALRIRKSLTAPIEILVQFLDFLRSVLITLTADIGSRLCEEISVLELNYLFCVVLHHLIEYVGAYLFLSAEDRLKSSSVPIQILFLVAVESMYDKSLVQFIKHIVGIDDISVGGNVSPSKEKRCFETQISLYSVSVCVITRSHIISLYPQPSPQPLCFTVALLPT